MRHRFYPLEFTPFRVSQWNLLWDRHLDAGWAAQPRFSANVGRSFLRTERGVWPRTSPKHHGADWQSRRCTEIQRELRGL